MGTKRKTTSTTTAQPESTADSTPNPKKAKRSADLSRDGPNLALDKLKKSPTIPKDGQKESPLKKINKSPKDPKNGPNRPLAKSLKNPKDASKLSLEKEKQFPKVSKDKSQLSFTKDDKSSKNSKDASKLEKEKKSSKDSKVDSKAKNSKDGSKPEIEKESSKDSKDGSKAKDSKDESKVPLGKEKKSLKGSNVPKLSLDKAKKSAKDSKGGPAPTLEKVKKSSKNTQSGSQVSLEKAQQPQRNSQLPTLPVGEVDFPRGGGTQLTAYEHAQAKRDGAQEAEQQLRSTETAKPSRKRLLSNPKSADGKAPLGKKRARDVNSAHIADALRIEHLNHKRLIPGIKLAGVVIEIRPLEIIVALPSRLLGHIPITEISSYYTKRLEAVAEDEEESEDDSDGGDHPANSLKGIEDMFTVGQWIRCSVVKTTSGMPRSSTRVSPLVRSALRVTLTVDPTLLNSGVAKNDLGSGMTLTGAVKSIEDRGYIVDFGIPVMPSPDVQQLHSQGASRTVTAFISFAEASKSSGVDHNINTGLRWEVGEIVFCRINKMSENRSTCIVSVDAGDVARSVLTVATNIDSVLPLHMVSCLITAIIPGQGLNVEFLGFKGTIDTSHIGSIKAGEEWEEKFKVGQKLRARILWDTIPAKSHGSLDDDEWILGPKIFSLSLLDHVIKLACPGLPASLSLTQDRKCEKINQIVQYPVGYVFQVVRICRVVEEWGLYAICSNKEDGLPIETSPDQPTLPLAFVHIAAISDSHISSLSPNSGPYKLGSTHKARVTGVSPIDGILQLSLQPSMMEKTFMCTEDIPVGEFVVGKVKKLTPSGLFISIDGDFDCVVWPDHYSDVKLKHPEKKFKEGAQIHARVLSTNPEKERVVLTLRKTLLQPDTPIITSYETAAVGTVTHALVKKVEDKSMLVDFFGQARGQVPISEAAEGYTTSMKSLFTPGNLVRVQVTEVNVAERKITASVRLAMSDRAPKLPTLLNLGDEVLASVKAIHSDNVVLDLRRADAAPEANGPSTGLISLKLLAKKYQLSPEDLKTQLKPGDEVEDLIVTAKDEAKGLAIVGFKKVLSISAPVAAQSSMTVGDLVTGTIHSIHPKNLVLSLRRSDETLSTESPAEGLLSIPMLAKHRCLAVDELKLQLKVGDEIPGLSVTQKNEDRGLLIVGFSTPMPAGTLEKNGSKSSDLETLAAGDLVVGTILKVQDKSVLLLLKKEGSEELSAERGFLSLGKIAQHRHVSMEQLRTELKNGDVIGDLTIHKKNEEKGTNFLSFRPEAKKALPNTQAVDSNINQFSIGQSVVGTVQAIHDKNVVLSLQREGDEDSETVTSTLGLMSSHLLAGHRRTTVDGLKSKLVTGEKIHKLTVKKINPDKGLLIVGFQSEAPSTKPFISTSANDTSAALEDFKIGKCLQVSVIGKTFQGLKVSPKDISLPGWTFVIDFPDISDDFDEKIASQKDDTVEACVVQVDRKALVVYLSSRPSVVHKSAAPPLTTPIKDRHIRSIKDLKTDETIRGFVSKISIKSGLIVRIGTNLQAKVKIADLFDKDIPNWPEKFKVGQVVSGKLRLPTKPKQSIHLVLREHPEIPKSGLVLASLKIGQIVSTVVRKVERYGMFLQIAGTKISGLCHCSQMFDDDESDEKKKKWSGSYSEGMKLNASILEVDLPKRRVGFSIKPAVVGKQESTLSSDGESSGDESDPEAEASRSHAVVTSPPSAEECVSAKHASDELSAIQTPSINIDLTGPSLPVSTGFSWTGEQSLTNNPVETESEGSEDGETTENDERPKNAAVSQSQSAEELEKLLLASPNSSELWIRLMSLHVQKADVPLARQTAKRALEGIHYREESEKWKIWIALLDLENTYGTEEQFAQVFADASVSNDTKTVWLKVADMYFQSGKMDKADELYAKTVKKFSQSSKVWSLYGTFSLKNGKPAQAADLLARSLKSLPKRKHIKTITKFAQIEFKHGDVERGRTLFEGLVATYPKRLDLWNVYVDLEIKSGPRVEIVRGLILRMLAMKLNPKRTKSVFKKWLAFEKHHGDEDSQQDVIDRAKSYVESLVSTESVGEEEDDEKENED